MRPFVNQLRAALGAVYPEIDDLLGAYEHGLPRQFDAVDIRRRAEIRLRTSRGASLAPVLLFLGARLQGYRGPRAIDYAIATDFIQFATSIHEKVRRRNPMGEGAQAPEILLGDFLFARALTISVVHNQAVILRHLCDMSLRLIEGALFARTKHRDPRMSEADYFAIASARTAIVTATCAVVGGLLGDADACQQQVLFDFGFQLGTAAHILDDLVGPADAVTPPAEQMAAALSDGYLTLAAIAVVERGGDRAVALITRLLNRQRLSPRARRESAQLLAREDAVAYAYTKAAEHANAAKCALEHLPPSPDREAMGSLADVLMASALGAPSMEGADHNFADVSQRAL